MAAQRGGLGGSPIQRRRCRCSSTATSSAAKRNSGHSWCLDGQSSGRPAQLSAWSTRYRRCVPTQACSTGADTAMRPCRRRGRDALLAEGRTASINGLYGPCTGTRRSPPGCPWPRSVDRHKRRRTQSRSQGLVPPLASHRRHPKMPANCACDALHAVDGDALLLPIGLHPCLAAVKAKESCREW